MRKGWIVRSVMGAALLLAMIGVTAGRALAQSNETAWLGVTTQEITSDLREGLDYQGTGVLVNRVSEDGPADRAGVRNGDVIVSFNSRTVAKPEDLTRMVRAGRVGQSVTLAIVRDGQRRTLTAKLAAMPDDESDRDSWNDDDDTPTPPPTPRAPRAPRAYTFDWNGGDSFDLPNGVWTMRSSRGRLGVQVQPINAGLADALGVTGGKGVLVMDVVRDTPAERAGIRAGDVIVSVGDRSIEDVSDLQRALEGGGKMSVTVVRKGARRTLQADIERRSSSNGYTLRRGGTVFRMPNLRMYGNLDGDGMSSKDRDAMEQELRQLRDEVRDLKRKLEDKD
jgi:C-terminal processing protease CtpA/Prc